MNIILANQPTAENQGFSFVELVATLVIFGIFTGISLVLLSKNIENERVRALTRQTASWLENTKKIAIQNDIPCEIKIDNSAHELSIPIHTNNNLLAKCMEPTIAPASLSLTQEVENTGSLKLCSKVLDASESATDSLTTLMASHCNAASSSTIFTPRGTLTDSVLITFSLSARSDERCIIMQSPNSLIRGGKVKGGRCDFSTAY